MTGVDTAGQPTVRPVAVLGPPRRLRTVRIALPPLSAVRSPEGLALAALTFFLVGVGLVMVLSASSVEAGADGDPYGGLARQATVAFVGTGAMLVLSRATPALLRRVAPVVYGLAVLLQLAAVFSPLGVEVKGNRNWLGVAGVTVQPSEFLKLGLILMLGAFFSRRPAERLGVRGLLPVLVFSGVALAVVAAGNDLGTCLVIGLIVAAALLFAGVRLPLLVLLGVAAGGLVWVMGGANASRTGRVAVWLEGCDADPLGKYCWQSTQAEWALGNGGVLGVGLGNSIAKWSWLPEADNDFIVAVIGEETGLVGLVVLLGCFVAMTVVLLRIIARSADRFTRTITGAAIAWLVGQAFLNLAVVLQLAPVFGLPLPFVSAGGSSLLASLLMVGCVMAVARASRAAASPPAPPTLTALPDERGGHPTGLAPASVP